MELTSNEALKQSVLAGLGYSIVPLIGIKNELQNGDLEIIPFADLPIITQWQLVWLSAKNLSPVAEKFLEYIHNEKSRIFREKFERSEKY